MVKLVCHAIRANLYFLNEFKSGRVTSFQLPPPVDVQRILSLCLQCPEQHYHGEYK